MENNRRNFIKKAGLLASSAVVTAANPLAAINRTDEIESPASTEPANKKFTVSILQTTDVHCQVYAHDELFWEDNKATFRKTGGYAQLATFLEQERKSNKHTFLIDTGDMFQGSQLSVKTVGKAMIPILNKLDYNLYLPGNWEVIYYKKNMQTLLGALNAPKVCANMYHDLGDGKKGELIFQPYYTWHVNGIKIGFLGYTDPLVPIRQSPNYSKGIIYTKPEENLAHYIDVLRNQEQCSAVIMLAHLGLSQQIHLSNLPECNGIDYILGGDTHERVRKPIVGKYAKVVEPGAFGSFVGKLNFTFENNKLIQDEYQLIEIAAQKYKPNKQMQELIAQHEEPFKNQINEIVGYSKIPLYRYFVVENTIDTMILDALNWKLNNIDIVLSNGFRFCPPRTTPDFTGNIPITNGYIYDMLPVDSTVKTGSITGKQLKEWLEKELNNVFAKEAAERFGGWVIKFKGMKITFNAFGEKGKRVQSITIKNEPLNLEKEYSICACERDGDPNDMLCRIKNVKNAQNTPFSLHSVIKDYLKANSPVNPVPPLAAKILDAPQELLTQVWGVDYQFS
jgi:2',3'-cyclic-nucleotide 2'-phosphodiesterase (5'-nucleotidase family)